MLFKTYFFGNIFLAILALASSSLQTSEDDKRQPDSMEKKLLLKPLIAAGLLAPLMKPILAGAAAGVIGGSHAASAQTGVTIEIEQGRSSSEENNGPISRKKPCGDLLGNKCYLLPSGCYCPVPTQKPWNEAFSICRSAGKRLLSIESPIKQIEMQLYLPEILSSSPIYEEIGFWTSGAYCVTSFTWTARPEYFTYTNWYENNEPTITGFPNGACVRAVPTRSYQWDDIDCGQYLPFVCEP